MVKRRSGLALVGITVMAGGPTTPVLSILTWNTLAPVYFRVSRSTEAKAPVVAKSRGERICATLASLKADVICLQEHWFDHEHQRLYEQLAAQLGYRYESLQRSGWNCDGRSEDGIAILVKSANLRIESRHDVHFHDYGIPQDRVAMLLCLSDQRLPGKDGRLAVMCTHLTFPHSRYDERSREAQILACLDACERHASGLPLILAGDLNGPSGDKVGLRLVQADFQNVWDEVKSAPCQITHCDHRGNQFTSDHIWLRQPARAAFETESATLLPEDTPDTTPMSRPSPGQAQRGPLLPQTFEDWCNLSDHRPLMAELRWRLGAE